MTEKIIEQNTITVAEYLLDQLYSYGVRHIFGVPGDYVLALDRCIENHRIQFVNATRENTAGYMADAYARMQGLGVACITYGVGINIVNATAQALVESSPVVIISGAAANKDCERSPYLHHLINHRTKERRDVTQSDIFSNLTIDQAILIDPHTALDQIDRVLHSCLKHKKPVYIEIPCDMVEQVVPYRARKEFSNPSQDHETLQEALEEIATILKTSQQPVLWIGHEVQRFDMIEDILRFAEKYHIPIATSLLGKGAISEKHPLFIGVYQGKLSLPEVKEYVESCDAVLIVGVLLSDVNTGIFSAQLKHTHRVLLNYNQVMVNHHVYAGISFQGLVKGLVHQELNIRFRHSYPACIDRDQPVFQAEISKKMTSARLFACLQTRLDGKSILVSDIGDALFGGIDLLVEQNGFYACAYFASLGFSVPAAIAIQLLAAKKRVVTLVGDGAFQMIATELSTAVRYGLDPIIIVLNNHGYGTERPLIEGQFNDILNWQYAELPKIFGGGKGKRVETEQEFDEALQEALVHRGEFYLIEVELNPVDFSPAMQRFSELVNSLSHG